MTESLYQEVILDHYKHPRSTGLREPFDIQVHQVNPTCGDEVTLRVRVEDDVVSDVSFVSEGCAISKAATSVMYELVVGESVAAARQRYAAFKEMMRSKGDGGHEDDVLGDGVAFAGVSRYPARVRCALLGWSAWDEALEKVEHGPS